MVHLIVANLGDILTVWFIILPFVQEKADIPIIKKQHFGWEKAYPKNIVIYEIRPEIDAPIEVWIIFGQLIMEPVTVPSFLGNDHAYYEHLHHHS